MTIDDCTLVELPTLADSRGSLTVAEHRGPVPFDVKRVFWVYDLKGHEHRGAHAHHELHELVVCLQGSLEVDLDDGTRCTTVCLDRPSVGLHLVPRIWRTLRGAAANTVYLVLASAPYDPADYIRDYPAFRALVTA